MTQTRTYDHDGQLIEVILDDGTSTETTGFSWDNNRPIPQIVTWTDTDTTNILYGNTRTAAIGPAGDETFAYNALSDVIATPGSVLAAADSYGPYGQPSAAVFPIGFGYRGELQTESQVHLRAREYHPTTGKFLSRDPLMASPYGTEDGIPSTANPYHYVGNDSINFVDPLGLCRASDGQPWWDPSENCDGEVDPAADCLAAGGTHIYERTGECVNLEARAPVLCPAPLTAVAGFLDPVTPFVEVFFDQTIDGSAVDPTAGYIPFPTPVLTGATGYVAGASAKKFGLSKVAPWRWGLRGVQSGAKVTGFAVAYNVGCQVGSTEDFRAGLVELGYWGGQAFEVATDGLGDLANSLLPKFTLPL
ncbi:MAG: RHS repeat-associated core domain-containing protein [Actinomycetia bacterium]|nr:RHS repeat-associated core domain-containing protein [Actinomycetes bacterium]